MESILEGSGLSLIEVQSGCFPAETKKNYEILRIAGSQTAEIWTQNLPILDKILSIFTRY
jgi:hypothetical protein